MGGTGNWHKLAICLFACGGFVGCITAGAGPAPPDAPPDPLLEQILKQDVLESKPGASRLNPKPILKEIPLQTPLSQARATMERHGFSCWSGLSDNRGEYLHCTAYKPKNQRVSEKILVKLYYDTKRVIYIEVTVEHDVLPPKHRSAFQLPPANPKPPAGQ